MKSELSARLLNGSRKTFEHQQQSLPVFIDLLSREKKREMASLEDRNCKRRKTLEACYTASTVKEDLDRGGVAYPQMRIRSSILIHSPPEVDMSKVSLVIAGSNDDGPSIFPSTSLSHTVSATPRDYASLVSSLMSISSSFYRSEVPPPSKVSSDTTGQSRSGSDWESSTSSISDSDFSNGQNDGDSEGKLQFISMGEALSVRKHPRLIALAFSPFVVVHVDASFTSITGQSSTCVLGRPLHELLLDPVISAALQTSDKSFSLTNLDRQMIKVKDLNSDPGYTAFRVVVSPIGQESQSITHFALDLERPSVAKTRRQMIVSSSSAASTTSSDIKHEPAKPMSMMG